MKWRIILRKLKRKDRLGGGAKDEGDRSGLCFERQDPECLWRKSVPRFYGELKEVIGKIQANLTEDGVRVFWERHRVNSQLQQPRRSQRLPPTLLWCHSATTSLPLASQCAPSWSQAFVPALGTSLSPLYS